MGQVLADASRGSFRLVGLTCRSTPSFHDLQANGSGGFTVVVQVRRWTTFRLLNEAQLRQPLASLGTSAPLPRFPNYSVQFSRLLLALNLALAKY